MIFPATKVNLTLQVRNFNEEVMCSMLSYFYGSLYFLFLYWKLFFFLFHLFIVCKHILAPIDCTFFSKRISPFIFILFADLQVVTKSPAEIPKLREVSTREGRHLCLQLNGPSGVGATALQYISRTNHLAVGFSDGYLQLWNMKTLKKEWVLVFLPTSICRLCVKDGHSFRLLKPMWKWLKLVILSSSGYI